MFICACVCVFVRACARMCECAQGRGLLYSCGPLDFLCVPRQCHSDQRAANTYCHRVSLAFKGTCFKVSMHAHVGLDCMTVKAGPPLAGGLMNIVLLHGVQSTT